MSLLKQFKIIKKAKIPVGIHMDQNQNPVFLYKIKKEECQKLGIEVAKLAGLP